LQDKLTPNEKKVIETVHKEVVQFIEKHADAATIEEINVKIKEIE